MSETEPIKSSDPVVRVARDLTEIVKLVGDLQQQATAKANDVLMPGGMAMVALGPEGNLAEWSENLAYDELHHLATCKRESHQRCTYDWRAADEDDQDHEPPLQTLLFWSEAWREEHGYPLEGRRPTIVSEANVIRHLLDWAWNNDPHWDDLAHDVNRTRVRLENVLYAGRRVDLTRVECDRCDEHARLIKIMGQSPEGRDDRWKCSSCRERFDESDMIAAYAAQLRRSSMKRFVEQRDAIGTLVALGRNERTVRRWLESPVQHVADRCTECGREWAPQEHGSCPGLMHGYVCGGLLAPVKRGDPNDVVGGFCEIGTRKVWVWWHDLWQRHNQAKTRRRTSA